MKIAKQLLALLLAASTACCAAACSQNGQDPTKEETTVILSDVIDETDLDKVSQDISFEIGTQTENDAITPHGTVTSGMVLQRRCVNCLTGSTTGTAIAAEFMDQIYTGTVTDGAFRLYLPPAEAGGPYTLTLYTETGRKTLTDIYIGEVFLLSGQSNMAYSVWASDATTGKETQALGDRIVQLYTVPWVASAYPRQEVDGQWQSGSGDNWKSFSAVGYLFGLEMYDALQIPIGLVQAAVGGSPLSYWLPRPEYEALCAQQAVFKTDMLPCEGYNGMIEPLLDMQFRGVVWYQGETNAGLPDAYAGELKFYIDIYRAIFNDFDMAFTLIELPRFQEIPDAWARVRQAQQQVAAETDHVCMSVSIDLGDMKDIHPADKTVIAKRAADATLEAFFGLDRPSHPRVVKAEKKSDTQVVLTLENAEGLIAKNGINGFQYSPDETRFLPVSEVTVSGNTVTVTAPEEIRQLRYGWQIFFTDTQVALDPARHVTVFNGAGLPLDQGFWDFTE